MKKPKDIEALAGKIINDWTERDITAEAVAGELCPAFEVDAVLEEVFAVMESGRHPILVGPPGVGKTAVVCELSRRMAEGKGPSTLEGGRILQFSFLRKTETFKQNDRLGTYIQELSEALKYEGKDVVPFFRDIHLADAWAATSQLMALTRHSRWPVIGEGTQGDVETMFEDNPEVSEHFIMLQVNEPSPDTMVNILRQWNEHQEQIDQPVFHEDALEYAIVLTDRFLAREFFPRKVLNLLAQVQSLSGAAGRIALSHVIDRFCAQTKVPDFLVDPEKPIDLHHLENQFRDKLLGQTESIKAIVSMIGMVKAGLSDARRPFGTFLFVGPSGVGKTLVAQLLAEYLFGSRERIIRLNMADYQQEENAPDLFGYPHGDGWLRRGLLTRRILGHAFAVLLFDEFEKAHPKIHDRFLQLMDEGKFINGAGETVSCRSMILIATSNAGSEVYREHSLGFSAGIALSELDRELDRRLKEHFRVEFLNRFDHIVHFHPLSRQDLRAIAMREIEQLNARIGFKQRNLQLEIDEGVLDWMAAHGYDPIYGARFLRRLIDRQVATALADTIVRQNPKSGSMIEVAVRRGKIVARIPDHGAPAKEVAHTVAMPHGAEVSYRKLDLGQLKTESKKVIMAAEGLLKKLEVQKKSHSDLLDQMNREGFWNNMAENQPLLDRYRELDVAIQMGQRYARPIMRLADFYKGVNTNREQGRLANLLQKAAEALFAWEQQQAEEGPSSIWLLIEAKNPMDPKPEWLEELALMELKWCRKLNLAASVVACQWHGKNLARIALEVEGPGSAAYLAMEKGLHRRQVRQDEVTQRAVISTITKNALPDSKEVPIQQVRMRKGPFSISLRCKCVIEIPGKGRSVEFLGAHSGVMRSFISDLRRYWSDAAEDEPELARTYGEEGTGARDPRSGVVVQRVKDVLAGNLDPFLESWRHRTG